MEAESEKSGTAVIGSVYFRQNRIAILTKVAIQFLYFAEVLLYNKYEMKMTMPQKVIDLVGQRF